MITIKRYTPDRHAEWNAFVEESRQGTFLFQRNYMDYHQDRFQDHSLMLYRNNRLCALLPANELLTPKKILISHQGLTYGGLLTCNKVTTEVACDIFEAIDQYLKEQGFTRVVYKVIPWIYHKVPSEEDLYALIHIGKARLSVREISTTIPLSHPLRFSELRRRCIKKAEKAHLKIQQYGVEQVEDFWNILNNNLHEKYGLAPVHTLPELQLLMSRFPKEILCYVVIDGDEVVGGSILYVTPKVIHTQYIAASKKGKTEGALDYLFQFLILQKKWDATFFDFGKSTEEEGDYLNKNLIHQKEGFGGRGVIYDTYEWEL